MLIVELFTVAKIWKQPMCPLIDEWMKKIWRIGILCFIGLHSIILCNYCVFFANQRFVGPCFKQVCQYYFSNNICFLQVSELHFHNFHSISKFLLLLYLLW